MYKEELNFPEDYNQENGNYINTCKTCSNQFRGNKHRIWCKVCNSMEPDWVSISEGKTPELPGAYPGCWLNGEMVGYARCMVKKVTPLRNELSKLQEENERLKEEKSSLAEAWGVDARKLEAEIESLKGKLKVFESANQTPC